MRFSATSCRPLVLALLAAGVCQAQAETPAGAETQSVRDLLDKYVETRRLISQEKRDAALGREMLADQIGVVKRQIDELRAKTAELRKEIGGADEKKGALLADGASLAEVAQAMSATVATLESRARELVVRLPDPLRQKVAMVSEQIPEKPGETRLSLGQRFLNVIVLLNEINRFNREVTVASELRTLASGKEAEVTTIYIGLGQAYYVNARKDAAGVGVPSAAGWIWTPVDGAAESIARLVAIHENKQPADFVRVPVRIE